MQIPQNVAHIVDHHQSKWRGLRKKISTNLMIQRAVEVQQIPAPTFDESRRANFVENKFRALRLKNIERDDLHNVTGWLTTPQESDKPILMISAHTDTVFPLETDLAAKEVGKRVYGPGIGDNSLGVSTLLLLAEIMANANETWDVPILFVANSREEGLGNLDGMRQVVDRFPPEQIGAAIVLEGMALGRVYHGGIAVRRLKVSTKAEGGHSWLHFGNNSAVHHLTRLCADITNIDVPKKPRTTFNIGMIEGGHSINSIATDAAFYLDMRSTTQTGLQALEDQVMSLIHHYQTLTEVNIEVIGNRPTGNVSTDHPLIQMALHTQQILNINPVLEIGSTDANYPLYKGIPSTVVGVTYGGNAHRLDEYIETAPLRDGFWHVLMLTLSMASYLET